MVIRGAPAIGVAAAMGAALVSCIRPRNQSANCKRNLPRLRCAGEDATDGFDLFWALERMKRRFAHFAAETSDLAAIKRSMVAKRGSASRKEDHDEAIGRFRRGSDAAPGPRHDAV